MWSHPTVVHFVLLRCVVLSMCQTVEHFAPLKGHLRIRLSERVASSMKATTRRALRRSKSSQAVEHFVLLSCVVLSSVLN